MELPISPVVIMASLFLSFIGIYFTVLVSGCLSFGDLVFYGVFLCGQSIVFCNTCGLQHVNGFQFCVSVHHIMINKNTSLMQLISIYRVIQEESALFWEMIV